MLKADKPANKILQLLNAAAQEMFSQPTCKLENITVIIFPNSPVTLKMGQGPWNRCEIKNQWRLSSCNFPGRPTSQTNTDHHAHTLSITFQHLPQNSARIGYTTEEALFISVQVSTDAVSTLWKVLKLVIRLWKQHSVQHAHKHVKQV